MILTSNLQQSTLKINHYLKAWVWCCEDFGLDETTDDIVQANKCIAENSVAMNEGYPMLVCGNMIAYFTAKLNSARGKKSYNFCICPTVYDIPTDHRKDKHYH